ncbi:MAG: hypothetical protein ABUT20_02225 [Bacteroidota bacterium]
MKLSGLLLLLIFLLNNNKCFAAYNYKKPFIDSVPTVLMGNFIDDYDIKYSINDTLWIQHPNVRYHILKWNVKEQYALAKNDDKNPSEAGLYTRIDYMLFPGMKPFLWGFCFTAYNATSISVAEATTQADRNDPKKGCNGFPFSRMKKNDKQSE